MTKRRYCYLGAVVGMMFLFESWDLAKEVENHSPDELASMGYIFATLITLAIGIALVGFFINHVSAGIKEHWDNLEDK